MPLGPVFERELLTTARRARYFALRFGFGVALLGLVWSHYRRHFHDEGLSPLTTSIEARGAFAAGTVALFAWIQAFAVYLITPAIVAGVIADEKQRKTLHYLLASRLTDLEIVLGKLAARLLLVLVLALSGLPILCALTLYGTVDPAGMAALFALTPVGALFVGGLSILASTWARRVREAVLAVYVIEFLGIFVLHEVGPFLVGWPEEVPVAIAFLNTWANPFPAVGAIGSKPLTMPQLTWLLGLQVALGLACVVTALARLRPAARAQEGGRRPRRAEARARAEVRAARPRRRLLPRPPIGADPMLWKEIYVWKSGALINAAAVLFTILVLVVSISTAYHGLYVVPELYTNGREVVAENHSYVVGRYSGYQPLVVGYSSRNEMNGYLRGVGLVLSSLWLLCVACMAAGGVTGEREADTWTSLTATMVEGREIVRAKLLGAMARPRGVLWFLALLWFLGVLLGAVHPAGYVAAMAVILAATWSSAAIGTWATLTSKNTMRAMSKAIVALVVVNGGYLIVIGALLPSSSWNWLGSAPTVAAEALWTYPGVHRVLTPTDFGEWAWATEPGHDIDLWNSRSSPAYRYFVSVMGQERARAGALYESAVVCGLAVVFHLGLAAILTLLCSWSIDHVIDRPRRPKGLAAMKPGPGDRPVARLQSAGVEATTKRGAGLWRRRGRRS